MTSQLVIDASVAGKWFLKDELEADVDLAEEILESFLNRKIELHAPYLFRKEVCGIFARACLTRPSRGAVPRLRKEDAQRHVRTLFNLSIQIHDEAVEWSIEALNLAVEYSKGYYDMIYLRLAEQLDCQWCTADGRVLAPTRAGFPLHRILHLSTLRIES